MEKNLAKTFKILFMQFDSLAVELCMYVPFNVGTFILKLKLSFLITLQEKNEWMNHAKELNPSYMNEPSKNRRTCKTWYFKKIHTTLLYAIKNRKSWVHPKIIICKSARL